MSFSVSSLDIPINMHRPLPIEEITSPSTEINER